MPVRLLLRVSGFALLGIALGAGPGVVLSAQPLEYQVKAAYVFNLANATEWPADAFRNPSEPFRVCVAQPSPFGEALEQVFLNEQVLRHPVAIAAIRLDTDVAGCHIVFVPDGADPGGGILDAARRAPMLTIGESATFAKRGGIITFVHDAGRIRLDVNQRAAAAAGVKLSSKVLQVARRIT